MDLALNAEEQEFRDEIRQWLGANVDRTPTLPHTRRGVRVGKHLAGSPGRRPVGRASTGPPTTGEGCHPRSRWPSSTWSMPARGAPQPVNRNGINHVGPTLLAHGTDEQKSRAGSARILDAAEIWCQLFSEPGAGLRPGLADHPSRAGGRRLGTPGPEGLDELRPVRPLGHRPGADRSGRPQAPRALLPGGRHGIAPGIEIRPLVTFTGESEFNEVFFDDAFVPSDRLVGGLNRGWSVANTTLAHERGTAFPFKEQVVHEVFLEQLYALGRARGPWTTPTSPTPWPRRPSSSGSSGCTIGGPSPG